MNDQQVLVVIITTTLAKRVPGASRSWVLTSKAGTFVPCHREAARVLRRQKGCLLLPITDHLSAFSHSPRVAWGRPALGSDGG